MCHAGSGSEATTAAITSVAIDDRRQLRRGRRGRRGRRLDHHNQDHDHDQKDDVTHDPTRTKTSTARTGRRALGDERNETRRSFRGGESTGVEPEAGAGAVVFCGDTKGNIRCFVEEESDEQGRGKEGTIAAAGSGSLGPTSRSIPRKRDGGGRGGGGGRRSSMEGGVPPCLVLKRQHGKDKVERLGSWRRTSRGTRVWGGEGWEGLEGAFHSGDDCCVTTRSDPVILVIRCYSRGVSMITCY